MNELIVKDVQFNGAMLKAAQDKENIVWVGVKWVCEGIGLSDGQVKRERKRLQDDLVLSKGGRNLVLPTNGGNQDVLCLMLDFLPLWLAKISITPTMQRENPELVENLVEYQLRAKDVLAEAFLGKKEVAPVQNPNMIQLQLPNIPDYTEQFEDIRNRFDRMNDDMWKITKVIMELSSKERKSDRVIAIPEKKSNMDAYLWKQDMYSRMDKLLDSEKFMDKSEIMKYIYRYMNKNYGIVWDQEIREYMERNNSVNKPNTIDIVYDNETYRSIFEAILIDMIGNSHTAEKKIKTTDDVIAPLIEKYNDNSNAGMATYRIVYAYMDENYKICWNNLQTRYINKFGGRNVSKKNIINGTPSLMKKFTQSVKTLLETE